MVLTPQSVYWVHRACHLSLSHLVLSGPETLGIEILLRFCHQYMEVSGQAFGCDTHLHAADHGRYPNGKDLNDE